MEAYEAQRWSEVAIHGEFTRRFFPAIEIDGMELSRAAPGSMENKPDKISSVRTEVNLTLELGKGLMNAYTT